MKNYTIPSSSSKAQIYDVGCWDRKTTNQRKFKHLDMLINDLNCPLCGVETETVSYVFLQYSFNQQLLRDDFSSEIQGKKTSDLCLFFHLVYITCALRDGIERSMGAHDNCSLQLRKFRLQVNLEQRISQLLWERASLSSKEVRALHFLNNKQIPIHSYAQALDR